MRGGRATTSFAGSRLSALAWPGSLRHPAQPALIVLLVIELLYLTIRFDTWRLELQSSIWTDVVGWSPQYLRLAITITGVTLLLSGRRLLKGIGDGRPRAARSSTLVYLAIHFCALLIFVRVTAIVFRGDTSAMTHIGSWVLLWFLSGGVTLASWGLALFPRERWLVAARQRQTILCWGVAAGTVAWICGFLTEAFWTPLARYTFNVVAWMLTFIYPEVVSDPARLVIGTPSFKVRITPQCSGYEGVGLILGFLTIYLWLFRRDLRFPSALALLPLGAAAIWILNALRVVALIIIGTSGWRAVALGGFHSQAGWLAFNAVGLGFVAIANHGRYFMAPEEPLPSHDGERDTTTAFLGPFVVIIATAMLTGAFSAGIDWLYPLRVFAAGAVLWMFRKSYVSLTWTVSWRAIAIGFVTFVIWLALMPEGVSASDGWPAALRSIPFHWAAAWLLVRVVGYVIAVPLVEELAFRGYLTRRIMRADFQSLPVGIFTWSSFVLSSVLFGAFHGRLWLAGTVAGLAYALALYQRRAFGDAVQAHATTNGLIALYVFVTGRWSVWS